MSANPIGPSKTCAECGALKPATPEFFQRSNSGALWRVCKDCARVKQQHQYHYTIGLRESDSGKLHCDEAAMRELDCLTWSWGKR